MFVSHPESIYVASSISKIEICEISYTLKTKRM
jgi:hypothetical protein